MHRACAGVLHLNVGALKAAANITGLTLDRAIKNGEIGFDQIFGPGLTSMTLAELREAGLLPE